MVQSFAPGGDTLEPERPGSGFGIKYSWPGLALVALGGAFLLAAAAIRVETNVVIPAQRW